MEFLVTISNFDFFGVWDYRFLRSCNVTGYNTPCDFSIERSSAISNSKCTLIHNTVQMCALHLASQLFCCICKQLQTHTCVSATRKLIQYIQHVCLFH